MKYRILFLSILPLLIMSCSRENNRGSSSLSSTSNPSSENIDVSFVALNDLHGVVDPRNNKEVGITKVATYLKDKKAQGSLLLNSGDMYQGTFVAGYDYGETISKVMKDIDFDSYTLGNHEFDWGIDLIKQNEVTLGKKFLGANIYTYPEKKKATDLGESYIIKTINEGTPNELKVGIIGAIGEDQITSITSTYVTNYTFVDPAPIIKDISKDLKDNQGCNIVVADIHASIEQINANEISKYVDAVFLAHTHRETYDEINNVPFIQGGRYSEAVAELTLTYNKTNKSVKNKSHNIQKLAKLNLKEDESAKQIIDAQRVITDPIGNRKLGTSSNYLSTGDMSCFYSKIAYEKAVDLGYNVDFVLFNPARYSLEPGEIKYSSLFETNPFNNDLYILSTNGYTIYREAITFGRQMGYNPKGIDLNSISQQKSTWYEVLVYDYNGFHIGLDESGNKYYDYFAASFTGVEKHSPIHLEGVEVLDLTVSRLEKNPTIISSDFSGNYFINQGLY